MKKLIAQRDILYESKLYAPGETLPAHEENMVQAWLDAGTAVWVETADKIQIDKVDSGKDAIDSDQDKRLEEDSKTAPAAATPVTATPMTAEPGLEGMTSDAVADGQLAGKVPKPGRPMKAKRAEK